MLNTAGTNNHVFFVLSMAETLGTNQERFFPTYLVEFFKTNLLVKKKGFITCLCKDIHKI